MAVLMISFLALMVLGCPIAFCLLCSGTLYFMANDMALIMVVQRLKMCIRDRAWAVGRYF